MVRSMLFCKNVEPAKEIYHFCFAVMLLCLGNAAAAQEKDEPGTKEIKMPKFSEGDFPKKVVHISDLHVLQMVWDSTTIGYVQRGLNNRKVAAVPSKPLTAFLEEHFNRLYKDDFKNDGLHLLWVVKDLRIGERTFFSKEYSYLRFNVDAYVSKDNIEYNLLNSIDTTISQMSGGDVTAWHGGEIEKSFKQLLIEGFEKYKNFDLAAAPGITIAEITQKERTKQDHPILNTTTYKEGAYMNFNEFLQNSPSINSWQTVVNETNGKVKIVGSNNDTINAWGLCKGGELYKYNDGQLVPVERQGNGFVISDYIEKANRRNKSIFFAAVFGGMIGGAIANSTATKLLLVTTIPYITRKQPEATCINMDNGEFAF